MRQLFNGTSPHTFQKLDYAPGNFIWQAQFIMFIRGRLILQSFVHPFMQPLWHIGTI